MSSALCFRINNTDLLSVCRSHISDKAKQIKEKDPNANIFYMEWY